MTAKRPAKITAGSTSAVTKKRLKGVARRVGSGWTLTDAEKERFDLRSGASEMIKKALPYFRAEDHQLLYNSLAAALSFRDLDKIIQSLEGDEDSDGLSSDLKHVRVGFELALQSLDSTLKAQGLVSDRHKHGGIARWMSDPKAQAMQDIRKEWEEQGRPRAPFAKNMSSKYQLKGIDISKGGIDNAIARWRKA